MPKAIIVLAALFGLLFGIDVGIITGALPLLTKQYALSPANEGFIAAGVPFGAIFGTFVGFYLVDRIGRRRVLLLSAGLFAAGAIASALSTGALTLGLSRTMVGVAIGVSTLTAPMYLAEIAPTKYRGAVVGCFEFNIAFGIFLAYGVDWAISYADSWRLMLVFPLVPALVCLVGMIWSPESPRWLVMKRQEDKARSALRLVQPRISNDDVERIVTDIKRQHPERPEEERWSRLAAPKLRPLLIFAVIAFFLQQFCGINAVLNYAPEILREAGMEGLSNQLVATVGLGFVLAATGAIGISIVDRIGRKPLFITGFIGTSLSMAVLALTLQFLGNDFAWLSLVSLFVFVFFFGISLGPLPWIYMSELFPLALRGKGIAAACLSNWICNWLVVFLFPIVSRGIGTPETFLAFAIFCIFGIWYSARYAPETKGILLEEVVDRVSAPEAGG
ncbi:sugar porter family MFS transporter [Roseibium sp. RKSG952]|uniref:sugar porter family MFS transporter n=1 Tax=Roseibium sp. RKSG952 TaxID=2529384 RepID=UPI0012BBB345